MLKAIRSGNEWMVADAFSLLRDIEADAMRVNEKIITDDKNFIMAHELNKDLQLTCRKLLANKKGTDTVEEIYKKTYLFDN